MFSVAGRGAAGTGGQAEHCGVEADGREAGGAERGLVRGTRLAEEYGRREFQLLEFKAYCEAVADLSRFRKLIAQKNADQAESGDVQVFATGAKQISVWRQLANDAEKRANAAGALFGMSPLARRNMKAQAPPQGELFGNDAKDAVDRYFQ